MCTSEKADLVNRSLIIFYKISDVDIKNIIRQHNRKYIARVIYVYWVINVHVFYVRNIFTCSIYKLTKNHLSLRIIILVVI